MISFLFCGGNGTYRWPSSDHEITPYSSNFASGGCAVSGLTVAGGPSSVYSYQCDDDDADYLQSWYFMPDSWDESHIPAVSGDNAVDVIASDPVTPAETRSGGDQLFFQMHIDATGTTAVMATVEFFAIKILYGIQERE